ncbi:hypothetical protein [Nonlabens antarcticus]|uniref:hypothetical protein n=1 Tax=Nonlabens antarcticus TaxID=392714 RepID=UPI001891E7C2|nr:hypothetical protein [Nonlabens antarcticus]
MIKKYPLALSSILILCVGLISTAQIGVNTNKPTANLDVNGTLRIRSLEKTVDGFQASGTVLYIMGVDEKGNVIPIEISENIVLEGNKLKVQLPEVETAVTELPNGGNLSDNYSGGKDGLINDLDLGIVILPGDPRGRRPVIRLSNGDSNRSVEITGFKASFDGAQAWLYPTSGNIKLKKKSSKSIAANQILTDKDITVKPFEMVQLMYDGTAQKWLIMSAPSQSKEEDD